MDCKPMDVIEHAKMYPELYTQDIVEKFSIHVKERGNLCTDIFVGDKLIVTIEAHPKRYPLPYRIVTPIAVLQERIPLRWHSSYEDIYRSAFKLVANYLLYLDYGTTIK